ncbi:bifunctional alpha/beta hydrolase/OsmC family protein [Bauldia litoralis]|uniref:bifunctional alpha/beta hydrolase/OsmC family protein n=1 Tax=Bauldia litoralis TaxID=665467 RepID=UPI003267F7E7
MFSAERVTFEGSLGEPLAARLDLPAGTVRAYAVFAHCFTCSKDVFAATRISTELARSGIAVLRFDFTGLGASGGDFANTSFSSNVSDILKAVDHLRSHYQAPQLMIGHSLGGAAVLMAASQVPEVRAVATVGAPADVEHVLHNFDASLEKIETEGIAEVTLAGRKFNIRRDFVDDARSQDVPSVIAGLKRALLVLHAPTDAIVGIENAKTIFEAARHPKSFVALDGADHLLSNRSDAIFAASIISNWAARYLVGDAMTDAATEADGVVVTESGEGRFQQLVQIGPHTLMADEPTDVGGDGSGPSPYDLLSAALGTCTAMTLRLYAERKKMDIGRISVVVSHSRTHAADCEDCAEGKGRTLSLFERVISIDGDPPPDDVLQRLLEIADRCPVHKTLSESSRISTRLAEAAD